MLKAVFSYNADIDKNAYLNWRTNRNDHIKNMLVLAEGFMTAAILSAKQLLVDNGDKKADSIIYPILFNTNHGIEVYLKALSWSLNKLIKTNEEFKFGHNLRDLLDDVKLLVNKFEREPGKLNVFNLKIKPLENYINELYSKIENVTAKGKKVYNIDFSRYTLDFQGDPQFYINELDNVVIDLENFIEVSEEIYNFLDRIAKHYLYDFEEE